DLQRQPALFAIDRIGIVARVRSEDDASAAPHGVLDRARSGPPRAFLAPELAGASGDLAACLGVVGAATAVRLVHDDRLFDQLRANARVEHARGDLERGELAAIRAPSRNFEDLGFGVHDWLRLSSM